MLPFVHHQQWIRSFCLSEDHRVLRPGLVSEEGLIETLRTPLKFVHTVIETSTAFSQSLNLSPSLAGSDVELMSAFVDSVVIHLEFEELVAESTVCPTSGVEKSLSHDASDE